MPSGKAFNAGRPYAAPPVWVYCYACVGITKHVHHKTSGRNRCMENNHTPRDKIVRNLPTTTLDNPLHECYSETSQSED